MRTIKSYLLNCSFHGIPFIADSRFHGSERLFWAASVALSWWASTYVMLSTYDQFKYSAISFTVDTSYLTWKTNFPSIIFCEKGNQKNYHEYAENWFGNESSYDTGDILKDVVFFKGELAGVSLKCSSDNGNFSCPLKEGNYTMYADAIRSTCNELFSFCSWNDNEFACCQHLLPVDTIYGVCFGINSLLVREKPTQSLPMFVSPTTTGIFTVELLNPDIKVFVLSEEAVPLYTDDSNIVMDGLVTSQHNKEENNIYLSVEEVVNDKDVKQTSIERRGCRFPDENNLKTASVYSYPGCIVDCLMNLQMQTCNCNHHLMPGINKDNMCNMDGLLCLTSTFNITLKRTTHCDCDTSCTETEVTVVGKTIKKTFVEFKHNETITKINFILNAPTLRCNRKVVFGYLDLIVSMGGTAGLCVGASLLTTVEIFYYLFVRPLNDKIIQKRKRKKKPTVTHFHSHFTNSQFPFVN